MKKTFLILLAFLSTTISVYAQVVTAAGSSQTRHKMAIFTPLYLDEAFDETGSYRFSTKAFPKNAIPGLEFYHGVSMAIDSLNSHQVPLDIYVYDTKSGRETLEQQFNKCATDGVDLIIANSSINEIGRIAKMAADKKIIVLNATVPNDGNASNNPYFVVLNSTLGTQVEGIYNYIKKQYPGRSVTFFTRKGGASEDYIKSAFESLNKQNQSSPIPVKYIEIGDTAAITNSLASLDKTQPALFLAGSLDNSFGTSILGRVAAVSKLFPQVTVIGMPTWDNINLSKSEYKGLEVIYSTPFYNAKNDAASRNISSTYNKNMYARPSDLVFRSFGLTYHFGRLLNQFGKELSSNLGSKLFRVFYDYDIQPVYGKTKLDYYENKKLYFLKYLNGSLTSVQ